MDRSGQLLLDKYKLTRMLGKGGMGEVWEGEHQLTGRRVAVKVLSDAYLSNKKVTARFGREARAASSVQHEGIVEILDQDRTAEGVPFLVMEFLAGESVGQRIKRKQKLSEGEALKIMLGLLDALDAAHQAGVIHRDLKPDNVFILPGVRGEERIKILDFGISQKADEIEQGLTQAGSVLGTPHYMSPEQARGEPNIDVRVDVYAAAVMMYECVVGEVPFDAGNYNALLQIILSRAPQAPRARGAEISAPMEQVLLACLAKKREERPPNARVMRELLASSAEQDDGAILDTSAWTFREPPKPVPASLAPAKKPAAFELETDAFKPALGTGNFDLPRGDRHVAQPQWSGNAARAAAPLAVEPAPLALELDVPVRHAQAGAVKPLEAEPPRPQPRARTQAISGKQRPVRAPKRSVIGAVVGWLAVLGAIGLLIYVGSFVFEKRDPRKARKAGETSAPAEPAEPALTPTP
ncbi:MAG TPA: serine/threonine-protein kinase [Polyangiales bacterium]|nr:serine/threonine-protein kinase [Polyangiales bacterium]